MRARKRRRHPFGCRHCAFVEAYRCERQRQFELSETVDYLDSGMSVVTFKEWLIAGRGQWELAA